MVESHAARKLGLNRGRCSRAQLAAERASYLARGYTERTLMINGEKFNYWYLANGKRQSERTFKPYSDAGNGVVL